MSHTFDLTCDNCGVKFCECHEPIYDDAGTFCSEECKDEMKEADIGEEEIGEEDEP